MIEALLDARARGVEVPVLAAKFHATLAAMIVEVIDRLREESPGFPVALSGGCFQNGALLRQVVEGLRARGLEPLHHRRVPPNDGGIALGQAAVACQRLA
jgi:hydrogenase maturation protein HypF